MALESKNMFTTREAAQYLAEHGFQATRTHTSPQAATIKDWGHKGWIITSKANPERAQSATLIHKSELDRIIAANKVGMPWHANEILTDEELRILITGIEHAHHEITPLNTLPSQMTVKQVEHMARALQMHTDILFPVRCLYDGLELPDFMHSLRFSLDQYRGVERTIIKVLKTGQIQLRYKPYWIVTGYLYQLFERQQKANQ